MPSPDSIRFIILVIPLLLILYGIIRNPLYSTIGYMWFVYCKTQFYYPFLAKLQGELIFAVIIIIFIIFHGVKLNRFSIGFNKVNKYLYVFIFCVFLSYLFAIDPKESWDYGVYHFLKALILYFMVMSSIENKNDLNIFIFSIVLMYAYLAYEPIYGYITGTGGIVYGYGTNYVAEVGILDGHVALANNMNQMISLTLFFAISQGKKIVKFLCLLSLFIFVIALIGSNSRGGFIGFVFFCVLMIYFLKAEKKILSLTIPAAALIFIISASFLYTATRITDVQVVGRLKGWAHGIEMVRVYGHILGVGPGCFAIARGRYFGMTMDSHNLYGQVVGELGIPGSIAWAFLIWQTLKNLQAVRKQQSEKGMLDKNLYYLSHWNYSSHCWCDCLLVWDRMVYTFFTGI